MGSGCYCSGRADRRPVRRPRQFRSGADGGPLLGHAAEGPFLQGAAQVAHQLAPLLGMTTLQTVQALTNGLVRANEWLQKASPAEIVAALPQEIVGSDPDTFGKSADNMRSCFSPDGLTAEEGPPHVLEILQASEPELKGAKIDLSQTFTNDFVREALKKYPVK